MLLPFDCRLFNLRIMLNWITTFSVVRQPAIHQADASILKLNSHLVPLSAVNFSQQFSNWRHFTLIQCCSTTLIETFKNSMKMASYQTPGIQQLMTAEKRAAEKVAEARKRKYATWRIILRLWIACVIILDFWLYFWNNFLITIFVVRPECLLIFYRGTRRVPEFVSCKVWQMFLTHYLAH